MNFYYRTAYNRTERRAAMMGKSMPICVLQLAYQYCYPDKKRTAENCTGTLPQSFMEALNAFYKEHPALYTADYEPEGFAWTDTQDEQETVLAFVRRSMVSDSTSQDLLVIANFTPVVRKDFRMGVLEPGKYKEIFNTDAAHFGGQNILNEQRCLRKRWKETAVKILLYWIYRRWH